VFGRRKKNIERVSGMAIGRLTVCDWTRGVRSDIVIDDPSWQDVEDAIRALDGHRRNDIYLYPDKQNEETWLAIGGGDGRYILTGGVAVDQEFPTLTDPGKPPEPEEAIVVGGQEGLYPGNWVLTLESALRGARAFYDVGGFQNDAPWTRV
jgi:hypothetical protein